LVSTPADQIGGGKPSKVEDAETEVIAVSCPLAAIYENTHLARAAGGG
jgi:hypothetical protein